MGVKKNDTDEINQKMKTLYESGFSLEEVGNEFGMTRQAVRDRFMKAGIERRQLESVDKDHLERLYSVERTSLRKIAVFFGVSTGKIERALKFYKIPKRVSLKTGGYIVDFLRTLEVGDRKILEWKNNDYPHIHKFAKNLGMRISLRARGDNNYEVTKIS